MEKDLEERILTFGFLRDGLCPVPSVSEKQKPLSWLP